MSTQQMLSGKVAVITGGASGMGLATVERFVAESESGMLHVNSGSFPENHLPFVGVKNSAMGVGGSNGPSTIQFYTTEHTVYRRATV